MTQTLDVHQGVSQLDRAPTTAAPTTAKPAEISRAGIFAITFGISFMLLYTVFERLNWPFFTYHPAVGKLDFWMQRPRSGEGPPMYWYGWLVLSAMSAVAVSYVATLLPRPWLYRTTVFGCVLAALWPAVLAAGGFLADQVSFDAEFLKSVWLAGGVAFVGAAAISYFASSQWVQRVWVSWLWIVPVGGLVVLGYSLKSYFLR
jgi:hypothetical protein